MEDFFLKNCTFFNEYKKGLRKTAIDFTMIFQTSLELVFPVTYAAASFLYNYSDPESRTKEPFRVFYEIRIQKPKGDIVEHSVTSSFVIRPEDPERLDRFEEALARDIADYCDRYRGSNILLLRLTAYYKHEVELDPKKENDNL